MLRDQNRHGSDFQSDCQPWPDLQLSAYRQEPPNVFRWWQTETRSAWIQRNARASMNCNILEIYKWSQWSLAKHTVPGRWQHLKTLLGNQSLSVLSLDVETRCLWPPFRLSLLPLTGHHHHAVICCDFQPRVLWPPSWEKRHDMHQLQIVKRWHPNTWWLGS